MMLTTKLIVTSNNEHGEGPVWDQRMQRLYWVDILKGNIHYANAKEQFAKIYTIAVGEAVGVVGLCEDQTKLVAGLKDSFSLIDIQTAQKTKIFTLNQEIADTRFNDGKIGPDGCFYAGTMGNGEDAVGNFYRLDQHGHVKLLEQKLQVSNGLAWSLDQQTFFLTDSPTKKVFAYDFDMDTGGITNRRVHIDSTDDIGVPDGMCIDAEGCIWSARWEGAKVVRYDPNGIKMLEVQVPALCPTSCCFGGEKMDQLVVTSSKIILSAEQLKAYPQSGNVFIYDTDTKGLPAQHYTNQGVFN